VDKPDQKEKSPARPRRGGTGRERREWLGDGKMAQRLSGKKGRVIGRNAVEKKGVWKKVEGFVLVGRGVRGRARL